MSDAAKKRAKQRWAIEKPKLDNARQWRGIFFTEPNDEEFNLTMKAARGQGPQGMRATGGGGLTRVPNSVCANTFCERVAHAGRKGEITSCRGTVQSAWQKHPVRRKGGRAGLPVRVSGRHVVRRTDRHHLSWKCAQVTGKAGENGQNSGEMGGSSPWTRPSAPECGDTLKALAGDQRSI